MTNDWGTALSEEFGLLTILFTDPSHHNLLALAKSGIDIIGSVKEPFKQAIASNDDGTERTQDSSPMNALCFVYDPTEQFAKDDELHTFGGKDSPYLDVFRAKSAEQAIKYSVGQARFKQGEPLNRSDGEPNMEFDGK